MAMGRWIASMCIVLGCASAACTGGVQGSTAAPGGGGSSSDGGDGEGGDGGAGGGGGTGLGDQGGGPPVLFRLPLADEAIDQLMSLVVGVDHDPVGGANQMDCLPYDGSKDFGRCYDGHLGTDYLLMGGFDTMFAEVAWVVAAADGVVVDTDDGHYDQCEGDLLTGEIDCHGHPMAPNYVYVEHAGGIQTRYLHLKKHSLQVATGDVVTCGQKLGLVGSSGMSMMPHLHFEVRNAAGEVIDPYAGVESQPESYWVEQGTADDLPAADCQQ